MTGCAGGFMSDPNSEFYIPDGSIQASSEHTSNYVASSGRLHGSGRWRPADSDTKPWIQADLGRLVNMDGIQTQGNGNGRWTTTLKVSTFQNVPGMGDNGAFIKNKNGVVKVCIKQKQ